MSAVTEDWKAQARELRESGLSEREVAESVGKAASTVHAFLKREGIEVKTDGDPEPEPQGEPDVPFQETSAEIHSTPSPDGKTDPHLTPFRAEQARLDAEHTDAGAGGALDAYDDFRERQARIAESGGVEWESESVYVPLAELRVDGTSQLSMFDVGGKRATDSSLRLQGGRVQLADGQAFRKGDVVRLEVTAVVREVGQRDKPDPATGIVVSAEQKHVAYITDLRVLS